LEDDSYSLFMLLYFTYYKTNFVDAKMWKGLQKNCKEGTAKV